MKDLAGSSMNCAICDLPILWDDVLRDWTHARNFAQSERRHTATPRREQPACAICGTPATQEDRCAACGRIFCAVHASRPAADSICIHTA